MGAPSAPPVAGRWRDAADDLRTLAWLHAAERDAATWLALGDAGFPAALTLASGDPGVALLSQALERLREEHAADARAADDRLAADYAAIYLTHALRASPLESVWRDEDHLMLQGPTFAVREIYQRHGLRVADWRRMPDDHLANELTFVAHVLERDDTTAALGFLRQHLLSWLPDFAARVAQRADTALYAALAVLTVQCCSALGDALAAAEGMS